MKTFAISDACLSLRPGAAFVQRGDSYDGLEWLDPSQPKPSADEVAAEIERLQADWQAKEYQRLREAEYPPMAMYLDAVVKGDQAQIDAYIAACQAVKAKYPKPV